MSLSQRGFTLMEVLVAVAVLATALAAAIRVSSQAGSNTLELRERTYAGWVAENQIARIRSGIAPLYGPATRSGTAEMAGNEWQWELTATEADPQLPIDIELTRLLQIDIEVYRQDAGERPVAVRSLWYQVPRPAKDRGGDEEEEKDGHQDA